MNSAFYRLPNRDVFQHWAEQTPPGFLMAVKASRYLTHVRRLAEPAEPVARFLDRAAGLGDRLGPILLQLPPTLTVDVGRLDLTLRQFPTTRALWSSHAIHRGGRTKCGPSSSSTGPHSAGPTAKDAR